jgi:hypothetical protein
MLNSNIKNKNQHVVPMVGCAQYDVALFDDIKERLVLIGLKNSQKRDYTTPTTMKFTFVHLKAHGGLEVLRCGDTGIVVITTFETTKSAVALYFDLDEKTNRIVGLTKGSQEMLKNNSTATNGKYIILDTKKKGEEDVVECLLANGHTLFSKSKENISKTMVMSGFNALTTTLDNIDAFKGMLRDYLLGLVFELIRRLIDGTQISKTETAGVADMFTPDGQISMQAKCNTHPIFHLASSGVSYKDIDLFAHFIVSKGPKNRCGFTNRLSTRNSSHSSKRTRSANKMKRRKLRNQVLARLRSTTRPGSRCEVKESTRRSLKCTMIWIWRCSIRGSMSGSQMASWATTYKNSARMCGRRKI